MVVCLSLNTFVPWLSLCSASWDLLHGDVYSVLTKFVFFMLGHCCNVCVRLARTFGWNLCRQFILFGWDILVTFVLWLSSFAFRLDIRMSFVTSVSVVGLGYSGNVCVLARVRVHLARTFVWHLCLQFVLCDWDIRMTFVLWLSSCAFSWDISVTYVPSVARFVCF